MLADTSRCKRGSRDRERLTAAGVSHRHRRLDGASRGVDARPDCGAGHELVVGVAGRLRFRPARAALETWRRSRTGTALFLGWRPTDPPTRAAGTADPAPAHSRRARAMWFRAGVPVARL